MEVDEEVHLEDYNAKWSTLFLTEESLIQDCIADSFEKIFIEHIGSTAVPGLIAKPIIDIMLGITEYPPPPLLIEKIVSLGYEYLKEASVADRLYFIKRNVQSYNLHIVKQNDQIWNNNLQFRDRLRSRPDIAVNYAQLKRDIFNRGTTTLLAYSVQKANFIIELIQKSHKPL